MAIIVPSLADIFPNVTAPNRYNAIVDLSFLSPNANVSSLIDNSTFKNTLGCSITSIVPQNVSCIQTCGNITDIFSSWTNFYTCSWYPALSEALNQNPNVSTAASLGDLGIYGHEEDLSSNTSSSIATCLADYCQSSAQCQVLDSNNACSLTNLIYTSGSSRTLNHSSAATCLRYGVCGTTDDVNPDIGGLGVLLSILIQYTISFFGIFMHAAYHASYKIAQYRERRGSGGVASTASLSRAENKLKRHLEALTSGLVEFQKSQCFFAATLQVAALIVLTPYLQQVQGKNQILLRLTAANSFAPIMLTLAHIEILADRNSKYLLLLASICFILGTAVYWNAAPQLTGYSINVYDEYTNPAVPIMSCGNLAPFAPCFVGNKFFLFGLWPQFLGVSYNSAEKIGLAVWIMSFLIWIYRVVYVTATSKAFSPLFQQAYRGFKDLYQFMKTIWGAMVSKLPESKHLQRLSSRWSRNSIVQILGKWYTNIASFISPREKRFWNYLQLVLGTAALLLQFTSIIEVLVFSSHIINTQMSFGQIVALGIWIPVMLEYAYLEINGAEEGTEYRLKSPLVVTDPNTGQKSPAQQPSASPPRQNNSVPQPTQQPPGP